jgi:hypothetical protein
MITLIGAHDFDSGDEVGSVNARRHQLFRRRYEKQFKRLADHRIEPNLE